MSQAQNPRLWPLDLSGPRVMGILNTTPDSFSDAGLLRAEDEDRGFRVSVDRALRQAEAMQRDGAAIVDVGGESTRPGAEPVSVQEEMDRVLPVVEALARNLDLMISVDTSTPKLMREAVALGAALINDVRALGREGALEAAADSGAAVCLMHMRGTPRTMQDEVRYDDVVGEVYGFLESRLAECLAAGIGRDRVLIDPGFGFGKTLRHNYQLLHQLERFQGLGCPVLVGMSRKSMIGHIVGRPVEERLAGSLSAAINAVNRGAAIVRCHDVAATVDAIKVNSALLQEGCSSPLPGAYE